ncbi:hypothetical protein [Acidisoma sp. S159]|uniref:hypothetical protein n=1 Tax=Acidisoma sp. S159 TaxID=1747225 RepID=UPI00131CA85C|nr:hypothetical protein [Acidisoma sp. S159]
MQSLGQKRKSALATLQYQRDQLSAEHDEAQDRANILFAQLRNNAELTQRIRSGEDPDAILLEMLAVDWSPAYRAPGQGLLAFT